MSVGGQANAGGRERVHLGFKDEFCLLVMGKSFNLRMERGNFYLIGLQGKQPCGVSQVTQAQIAQACRSLFKCGPCGVRPLP